MADFFSHIKDKRPAFICYPAGGKESPDYTVEIDHLLKPGASQGEITSGHLMTTLMPASNTASR